MSATLPFGPYELVRRLGSGGMAETFLAVRRGPGGFEQHVCVKRILPAMEADPELVRMFMDEARLAAQLRHSNITQVVDFGVAAGSHYLALELVDGMDLRALLRALRDQGRALDPPLAVYVGTQLAAALDFAHTPERGRHAVIHRDLSPSNVLVSRAGEVYLTDFGIARALGVKRNTSSGVVRGKVPYMASEYALTGRFDARSDLFALGVILFEALAGQRPFDGATDLDTLTRIKDGRHAPLASLAAHAPSSLVAIVEQLLVPNPEERFQSAAAVLEALAHVSAPPTVSRQLAELVRSSSVSLAQSLSISQPSRTAVMSNVSAPPVYPQVITAGPDEPTRTSDAGAQMARTAVDASEEAWSGHTQPRESWATTDPAQISQHDRPSPYYQPPQQPAPVVVGTPSSRPVPVTRSTPPSQPKGHNQLASPGLPAIAVPEPGAPKKRGGAFWLAVVAGGLLAFAAASAGAYVLVDLLRHGAP